jgi:hypothetical protein
VISPSSSSGDSTRADADHSSYEFDERDPTPRDAEFLPVMQFHVRIGALEDFVGLVMVDEVARTHGN